MAFTNAELSIGANIVLEALEYENNFKDVDLVIVGEGRTDKSTQFNKSPVAVSIHDSFVALTETMPMILSSNLHAFI